MRAIPFSLLFTLAMTGGAFSQKSEKSALERDPKGWINLMPGKDLKGWTRVPLAADGKLSTKNPWQVKGDVLFCDGVGIWEMLLYDRELKDGIFHVEWRFRKVEGNPEYNSGIYVRTPKDGKLWHQVQVAHVKKRPFVGDIFGDTLVKGEKKRVVTEGTGHKRANPPGEWNTYEITAKGKDLSAWVNGATTCVWKDCPLLKGHVGMQSEFYAIEFRNLKFKPLR